VFGRISVDKIMERSCTPLKIQNNFSAANRSDFSLKSDNSGKSMAQEYLSRTNKKRKPSKNS
jgi:hypothetical protein